MVRQNTVPGNRPNLFLELAHFIYDDAKIYQMMDGNLKNYIDQNIDLIDQIDGENLSGLRSCRYIRMLHCLSDGSTTPLDEWYNDNNSNGGTNEGFDSWSPWGQDLGPGPGNVINIYSGLSDGESLWDWIKKFFNSIFNNQNEGSGTLYAREEIIKKNKTNELKISKSDPKSSGNIPGLRNNTDCIIYYHKHCDDGNGVWFQVSLEETDECHQAMDNFLYQYNLNLDSEMIDFLMSQMNQGLCYDQEATEFDLILLISQNNNWPEPLITDIIWKFIEKKWKNRNSPYKFTNDCEKELIRNNKTFSSILAFNWVIANGLTRTVMGINGHNDCSDAFRHSLFSA